METTIFYFSATGNSLQIARSITEEIDNAIMLPMTKKTINEVKGSVGFIFPIYFNGLPRLVKIFIENLYISPNTYCFAVANSGGTKSNTLGTVNDILISKGLSLSFSEEIKMPTNYIIAHTPLNKVKVEKLISKAVIQAKVIAKSISNRKLKPVKYKSKFWSKIVNYNFLYKNADKWDEKFVTNNKCTGCGLCSNVCPVNNIKLENKLPLWQHKCEKCLACINWCPHKAIEYGKNTIKRDRYSNPTIKVDDILNPLEIINE